MSDEFEPEFKAEFSKYLLSSARYYSQTDMNMVGVSRFRYSLISLLAVAQTLRLEFLPITWEAARGIVGVGGTAKVHQALVDLNTNLAFKRIREDEKQSQPEEITILCHPSIREHPNIIQLQGLCWDISLDNGAWPVLVFLKSQYADLYSFATLPVGRELGVCERLKICTDIGKAIIDMHSNNIIHGDIKPENILIFRDETGTYTTRVMDFGYSTRYADDNDLVMLPISRPWNDPEHTRLNRKWKPSRAKKMDLFSFGMLCLWLLFEKYFSDVSPLPEEVRFSATADLTPSGNMQTRDILQKLKVAGELPLCAQRLLSAEKGLDNEAECALGKFFCSSLSPNPDELDTSLRYLLDSVGLHRFIIDPEKVVLDVLSTDFRIESSIDRLYLCDHRLRSYIVECLRNELHYTQSESITEKSMTNIAFQLALCYAIGFGVDRDEGSSEELLQQSGRTATDIEEALTRCVNRKSIPVRATTMATLWAQDHLQVMDFGEYYLERKNWENAEARIRREIKDLEVSVGAGTTLGMLLKSTLSSLYYTKGQWKLAEEVDMQVMKAAERIFGTGHPNTLASMTNLASTYGEQGRWEDAARLQAQTVEVRTRETGQDEHPLVLVGMGNLALTYRNQGKWTEAEEMEIHVMKTRDRLLGPEHYGTLTSMDNLALTYRGEGRWKDAELLQEKVVETSKRVLGQEHPSMLTRMANLASTYRIQGRSKDAELLGVEVMETSIRVLGPEHPDTLVIMSNLATTFWDQGRWEESESLEKQVVEISSRVRGPEHPETLTSISNLGTTYGMQGRHQALVKYTVHCC